MAIRKIRKHSKVVLVFALAALLVGFYVTMGAVRAADVTNFKDTLSDSRPTVEANHTLSFTIQNAIAEGNTLIITFGTGFNNATNGTVDYTDIDLTDDGVDMTLAADCASTEKYSAVITGDIVLTFTACSGDGGAMVSGSVVTIEVGTNATSQVAGNAQFENGNAGTEDADITGTFSGTGSTKVIFIAGVTVSATVADPLSVTVAAVNSGSCSIPTGTSVTTTATTVPFSAISANTLYNGCQSLTVSTNASDGYTATVQETDQLTHTDTTSQIADGTCDGSCSDTAAAAWGTVTSNGFGYCMDDVTGDAAITADATGWATANQCDDATPFFKTLADAGASETARSIMQSAAAVSGDNSLVGFRLDVSATQKGGVYSNTIVYIVTPQYD